MGLSAWFKHLIAQPPAHIVQAKRQVDASLSYWPYTSYAKLVGDTPVRLDERRPANIASNGANCVGYAKAYRKALGGKGKLTVYQVDADLAKYLGQGWHCVLDIDGWRLDCMVKHPIKL